MNVSEPLITHRYNNPCDVKTRIGVHSWDKLWGRPILLPWRHPVLRRHESILGSDSERENLSLGCQGSSTS